MVSCMRCQVCERGRALCPSVHCDAVRHSRLHAIENVGRDNSRRLSAVPPPSSEPRARVSYSCAPGRPVLSSRLSRAVPGPTAEGQPASPFLDTLQSLRRLVMVLLPPSDHLSARARLGSSCPRGALSQPGPTPAVHRCLLPGQQDPSAHAGDLAVPAAQPHLGRPAQALPVLLKCLRWYCLLLGSRATGQADSRHCRPGSAAGCGGTASEGSSRSRMATRPSSH